MRGTGMDLLWRILAALSFDCFKDSSPTKLSSSQAGSLESSSLTGSLSLGPDLPHCQCCISYEARLKRLSCGHLYCDPCCDQIVNLAFEDIEGLSDYPCPMCKSIRQLGGL
uniref:Si:ch211-271d10.2 n=1 Tax=Amphiprion percula TaxID=161767 RepID=A0A3P8U9Q6_AMPPE